MSTPRLNYVRSARVLHWSMAVLILVMLAIGTDMVNTVGARHQWWLALHKPLGILLLLLAIARIYVRLRNSPPPLPGNLSSLQRKAAQWSHRLFYVLMMAMPLSGWAMLSAAGAPITLGGLLRLPAILAENPYLFAWLRALHGVLANALYLLFVAHMGAALHHALIHRDGIMRRMLASTENLSTESTHHRDVQDAQPPVTEP